jgi:hypothetical protein
MDDPPFTTKLAAIAPMVVAAAFPGGALVKGWWPQAVPPAKPAAKVRERGCGMFIRLRGSADVGCFPT